MANNMILRECYSVSILLTHSVHDRPPQSDASKFRVLFITHRQYISRLDTAHLSINRQSEINRLSRDGCMCRPYVCFMIRKT